jgi:release factor glutamine methyltransferase
VKSKRRKDAGSARTGTSTGATEDAATRGFAAGRAERSPGRGRLTVREALALAEERLTAAGVETPRVDSELLLSHVLGTTRTGLYVEPDAEVEPGWEALLERRERREPLAYVLGEWGFRRLTLHVDPRVLVPRPETEVVVERCLERLIELPAPSVLDIGTGSGAIALAIADEDAGAEVTAIDSSPDALEVAQANAAAAGLSERVRFVRHNLADGLALGEFDLVVSNPPYVTPDEINTLEPEVRDWEPRDALVGRGVAEQVAAAARACLRAGGWLVLEAGAGSAGEIAAELEALGYGSLGITADLTGIDRVVEGQWS